jgi:hypothetical protein
MKPWDRKKVVIYIEWRLEFMVPANVETDVVYADVLANIDTRETMKSFMAGFDTKDVTLVCTSFDKLADER